MYANLSDLIVDGKRKHRGQHLRPFSSNTAPAAANLHESFPASLLREHDKYYQRLLISVLQYSVVAGTALIPG